MLTKFGGHLSMCSWVTLRTEGHTHIDKHTHTMITIPALHLYRGAQVITANISVAKKNTNACHLHRDSYLQQFSGSILGLVLLWKLNTEVLEYTLEVDCKQITARCLENRQTNNNDNFSHNLHRGGSRILIWQGHWQRGTAKTQKPEECYITRLKNHLRTEKNKSIQTDIVWQYYN